MVGCSILLYNCRANTMDGASLSYTCMASAIIGGLCVHTGTRIAVLVRLLKLITVLGSSAFQKALTGKKWAGRAVPRAHFWTSKLPGIYTSPHLDFHTSKHLDFYTYERLYFYTHRLPHIQTSIHTYRRPYI